MANGQKRGSRKMKKANASPTPLTKEQPVAGEVVAVGPDARNRRS
jgi:hypothetical protein